MTTLAQNQTFEQTAIVVPISFSVLDNNIRVVDGLYSLNDLHKASGNDEKHKPSNFLRNEQTQALIVEIEAENQSANLQSENKQFSKMRSAVKVINGGLQRGTYVCRELVYAYAMWISAKFHLLVIRAFDAMYTQKVQPTFDLTETLSQTLNQISKGNKKLYKSMYNGLMRRFAVGRLADIPNAEIQNALATIYFFAVEWHRKNTPTQLPLKLNDGEHYLVVKDGVVLWERKLKPNCNDIPANTLQNPKLMLEHIREVVGEFVGKEALPAPKPQNSETVRELVERVLIQNFTLNHIWKSLHTLDKGLYLRAINYVVNTNVRVLRVIEDFGFKTKQGNDMISCDFRTIQLYDGRTITGCNPNYFNAFA